MEPLLKYTKFEVYSSYSFILNNTYDVLLILTLHNTSFTYFITYLITSNNNPINGLRPAATHPSRSLCFLRAYACWLHQSMQLIIYTNHKISMNCLRTLKYLPNRLCVYLLCLLLCLLCLCCF